MPDTVVEQADRRASAKFKAPPHVDPSLVYDIDDYFAATTAKDAYGASARAHEELPPMFFSRSNLSGLSEGAWFFRRYEDIKQVYLDDQHYSAHNIVDFPRYIGEKFLMLPLSIDRPEHTKYRILLNPWFSPKAINEMEARIRATVVDLIEGFVGKGECDTAYDFGRLYPVRVFMNLMGFPPEMLEDFLKWEYALLHSQGEEEGPIWGFGEAIKYLRGFIEERRRAPKEDLTSYILKGEVEGRPLTEDEILGIISFLWVGGLDTVAATSALSFRMMALDEDLQDFLRAHPETHAGAVEEFLRMNPTVNSTRHVTADHEVYGVLLKKGDRVVCLNTAGNYDPEMFPDPRKFDVTRPPKRHFTLSFGVHNCLGAHLARREMKVAFSEFLARVPKFKAKPGADLTVYPGLMATLHMPVVW
jgi:cytochrome P450